jgi:hypothetical protein
MILSLITLTLWLAAQVCTHAAVARNGSARAGGPAPRWLVATGYTALALFGLVCASSWWRATFTERDGYDLSTDEGWELLNRERAEAADPSR